MNLYPCSREKELTSALKSGQWPEAGDADLRAHVEACSRCKDLVVVTESLRAARSVSMSAARLEAPGVLWWRAQLRRRKEAVERIGRPVSRAQGFALAVNLLLLVGLVATHTSEATRLLERAYSFTSLHPGAYLASVWVNGDPMVLISALGILILLGGVAFYVALER